MADKGITNMSAAITAAVVNDTELRGELREMVREFVAISKYTMKFGTLAERMQLARIMTPALLRGLDNGEAAGKNSGKEQAWERIKSQMRGEE